MRRMLIVAVFIALNVIIFSYPTGHDLKVTFLDIGQGDAVFLEGPTGVQLLVDGGPSRAVLGELSQEMSFFDRTIDAVLATHPDQDHIGGLSSVLDHYEVMNIIESGNTSKTPAYTALKRTVAEESVNYIEARAGMRFLLGAGAYADVLFPDHDVSGAESNTASIILRVVYGDTEFLLTGDSPQAIEKYLVRKGTILASDVLKAGHHGSKTSSAKEFVDAVHPSYVVISAGKNNKYGHPHQETLDVVRDEGAEIISTQEAGTIHFTSNGKTLRVLER